MSKQYGLVFELGRCIGCRTCVIACKVENNIEGPGSWIRLLNSGAALNDAPKGKYPEVSLFWQPVTCMHCKEPPCLDACPEDAIHKRHDGIVFIDPSKCTGCQLCKPACPYDAICFSWQNNIAQKCNLCSSRVEQGLLPFCVKECIWGAIHFGDTADATSEISQFVNSQRCYTLDPKNHAKPSNYYLLP